MASLVVDEEYYFVTSEMNGSPVIRFKDRDDSYSVYKECMMAAVSNTEGFYYLIGKFSLRRTLELKKPAGAGIQNRRIVRRYKNLLRICHQSHHPQS